MWQPFLGLCLALSGKASQRPATRRRPAFHRPSHRPRLEALEDRCLLSAGALDTTFGNGAGYVTTSISSGNDIARVALIQPDGKIVATGEANPSTGRSFAVARYNRDGSLDTSFGTSGTAQASFASTYPADDYAGAALQSDGKIVMAGWDRFAVTAKKVTKVEGAFVLARFKTDGTLDSTFGSGGKVTTLFATSSMTYGEGGVVVTSAGQIVVAGDSGSAFVLARYNANGGLDTNFGSGGEVFSSFAQFPSVGARALLQQPDGKLIVVGDTNGGAPNDWLMVRYNADGTLDTNFGSQGLVATPLSGEVGSGATGGGGAALYPSARTANDGKIVVVGSDDATKTWQVVRYNADGSLDTTFGNGGVIVPQISGGAVSVALDASGRPVAAGSGASAELARFNLDGTPDTTFGAGGLVTTPVGSGSQGRGVAIYPSTGSDTADYGKIVMVGNASNGTNDDFLVARYLPSEPEVGSFTASPNPVTSGSGVTLSASNLTDANPGVTVTQVTFYYYDGNGNEVTLGTTTTGSGGAWSLTFTVTLSPGLYTVYAQATDSYGVHGDPIALSLTVQ
jgi:uncharacterized delta-60 repeat protein